jgi:hypothetical protein
VRPPDELELDALETPEELLLEVDAPELDALETPEELLLEVDTLELAPPEELAVSPVALPPPVPPALPPWPPDEPVPLGSAPPPQATSAAARRTGARVEGCRSAEERADAMASSLSSPGPPIRLTRKKYSPGRVVNVCWKL